MTEEKIMIVDDNTELLEELREILTLSGYSLLTVSDSTAAVEAAAKFKPDIIVLDLKMNQMNGFQVAKKLKQLKATSSIPIIAMSGYFPIEVGSTLLDMEDMSAKLKKPFSISDLITQIETLLANKKNKNKVKGIEISELEEELPI